MTRTGGGGLLKLRYLRRVTTEDMGKEGTHVTMFTLTGGSEREQSRRDVQERQWRSKIAKSVKEVMNWQVFFPFESDYAFGTNVCKLVTTRCGLNSWDMDEQDRWWDGTLEVFYRGRITRYYCTFFPHRN